MEDMTGDRVVFNTSASPLFDVVSGAATALPHTSGLDVSQVCDVRFSGLATRAPACTHTFVPDKYVRSHE
jgi:hypothetical protein